MWFRPCGKFRGQRKYGGRLSARSPAANGWHAGETAVFSMTRQFLHGETKMKWNLTNICVAAIFSAAPAAADDKPLVVELWPGKAPEEIGNIGAELERPSPKLSRKEVEVTDSTKLITNVTKSTITIHRPAKEKDTGTAIVICPGGGYWNLYWELEGEEVAAWLNSIGVTGIILKYRVPRRPDDVKGEPARRPLQDAQRAVSLIRSKASDWGIDPKRIGMVGFSAGGQDRKSTRLNSSHLGISYAVF